MDENQEDHHSGGFLIGLLVGGVLGAVAAYFATSDKEDKAKLLAKGKMLLENVKDFGLEVKEKGEEVVEEVKERVSDIPSAAEEAVKNVQVAAEEAIEKITLAADKAELNAHKEARKFFLQKGKSLVKKSIN